MTEGKSSVLPMTNMYMHESNAIHIQRSSRTFRLEMIKQNEIKVLLMANVHGGNLHHIYADTEILSARLLIILSMARYSQTFIFSLYSYQW